MAIASAVVCRSAAHRGTASVGMLAFFLPMVAFLRMDRSRENTLIMLLISDPDMRTVIRDSLGSQGYLVEATGDIGVAVDRLRECTPDLLIIRPYISSMPSHDAVKYLRTKCPGLRVLMVGGLIDDDRLSYKASLQDIHIFPKPFTAEQLFQAVQKALSSEPGASGGAAPPRRSG
jgi:DNA-binding NtrC family response regulator